ncbi:MAG: sigma-70 family RNA polymerase sigma factor [Prevotella sp.]|nr:sigma-70 family RNA polymerase sigma factor [Prevotella sp.]
MPQSEDKIFKLLSSDATRSVAFEKIVKLYSEKLYWKIRYIVLNHDDANDVLQNTFLKAWTNLDSFQNKSKLQTWLYSIAINESLDFLRRNKNSSNAEVSEDLGIAKRLMADEYFDGDEIQAKLLEAIALLPDVQRTVFNLRYFQGMKYSQMSKVLKTSEGALKASYHIAAKKIVEYFNLHEI